MRIWNVAIFALVAAPCSAQVPYSQGQAASFLELSNDILAAIAPSIDPVYKLAAQTTITFPETTPSRTHWSLIQSAMGDSHIFSISNAERVTFFRALVSDGQALTNLVTQWAGVPASTVLVVADDAKNSYTVTITQPVNPLNTVYKMQFDTAQGLLNELPTSPNCYQDTGCICSFIQNNPFIIDVRSSGCQGDSTFRNGTIGWRFTVDLFADYDTPNAAVAASLAQRWTAIDGIPSNLPAMTLQKSVPVAAPDPGPLNLTAVVFASIGFSAAAIVVGAIIWLRNSGHL